MKAPSGQASSCQVEKGYWQLLHIFFKGRQSVFRVAVQVS